MELASGDGLHERVRLGIVDADMMGRDLAAVLADAVGRTRDNAVAGKLREVSGDPRLDGDATRAPLDVAHAFEGKGEATHRAAVANRDDVAAGFVG